MHLHEVPTAAFALLRVKLQMSSNPPERVGTAKVKIIDLAGGGAGQARSVRGAPARGSGRRLPKGDHLSNTNESVIHRFVLHADNARCLNVKLRRDAEHSSRTFPGSSISNVGGYHSQARRFDAQVLALLVSLAVSDSVHLVCSQEGLWYGPLQYSSTTYPPHHTTPTLCTPPTRTPSPNLKNTRPY